MVGRALGVGVVWGVAVGALLAACGGKSTDAPSGGAAPAARGCSYEGEQYADGQSFRAADGCNSCSCEAGNVSCTEIGCGAGGCTYQGKSLAVGTTVVDDSGNDCLCKPDGTVTCKPRSSPGISCEQVVAFYDQLLEEGKACDPHGSNPCTLRVSDGLGCGCETYVNPKYWDVLRASAYTSHYTANACGADVQCGPCRAPVRGACSVMDGCEDAFDGPPGAACKVNGTIYSDGRGGIPDPASSCNTCVCNDGRLSCETVDCPVSCPTGTKLATSCAQCGPADACEVVEYSCRPTCTDTCAEGSCIDGACIVGICG